MTREAEEEMGQMTRFAGLETTGLKLEDVASCDTFQSGTLLNRHSPDDSEISVESSDFAASLEARREMWLATSSSGSPNDG